LRASLQLPICEIDSDSYVKSLHPPFSSSRKQWTVALLGIGQVGVRVIGGQLGIQLAIRIFTDHSLPMPHWIPCLNKYRPNNILLKVQEDDRGFVAFQKSESGKYLPLRTRAHREFGSVSSLHPCLASIAWLKRAKSRKPMPPKALV
jgi:hypothetical protein